MLSLDDDTFLIFSDLQNNYRQVELAVTALRTANQRGKKKANRGRNGNDKASESEEE